MTNQINATVDWLYLGEYVDEAECPDDSAAQAAKPVRPQIVAEYLDYGRREDEMRPDRQGV